MLCYGSVSDLAEILGGYGRLFLSQIPLGLISSLNLREVSEMLLSRRGTSATSAKDTIPFLSDWWGWWWRRSRAGLHCWSEQKKRRHCWRWSQTAGKRDHDIDMQKSREKLSKSCQASCCSHSTRVCSEFSHESWVFFPPAVTLALALGKYPCLNFTPGFRMEQLSFMHSLSHVYILPQSNQWMHRRDA